MDFEIICYRGDTPTIEFELTDDNGQPLNLSGWTLYFAVRKYDGTVFIDKQMTVVEPLAGKVQVRLSSDETNNVGTHIAEIEARRNSDVITLGQGLLIIRSDVRQ